jgi:hypothetical protein
MIRRESVGNFTVKCYDINVFPIRSIFLKKDLYHDYSKEGSEGNNREDKGMKMVTEREDNDQQHEFEVFRAQKGNQFPKVFS